MNPVDFFVPPSTIFPRKKMKSELFNNAPEGTVPMISEGGFINKELFTFMLPCIITDFF